MKSKKSLGAISVANAVLASAMLGAISGLLVARPTNAHAAVGDITEYSAPTPASEPIGIASGPDSNLWVTESGGNEIAKVTTSGVFTEYSVPTTGSSPFGIAVGPDNNLWFTENSANKVGAITTSGDFREFSVPTDLSAPTLIAAGPDGNLWFTEQAANKVAKVTTTGVFTEYPIPTSASNPYGIAAGPDGNLWITEVLANKVARVTTTGGVTEYPTPTANSGPLIIAPGPDGNLWFTEYNRSKVARITTSGLISEYSTPTAATAPYGIAAGPDGNLWFTEYTGSGGPKVGKVTTAGFFTEYAVPTAASTPHDIAAGADGNLWFTEQAANKVSKVSADGANFTVTSNSDADHQGFCSPLGACTLRDAVNAANLQSGPDMIAFNILPGGVQTIQPTSPLPTVTDPVVIDGSTQRGASCPSTLLIEIDGSVAGSGFVRGLHITAGSSTVRGLVINRFDSDGILLETGGGNHIECDFIGTDVNGTVARGNGSAGIQAFHSGGNVIGGTSTASRNVLSGNGSGVETDFNDASNNVIQGNLIGTDVTGSAPIGNLANGLSISSSNNVIGGAASGARNVISGNGANGIQVGIITGTHATGNMIEGNYIGTDATGTTKLGNHENGLALSDAAGTVIGGNVPGAGNIISDNTLEGIELDSADAHLQGNLIGVDITGKVDLGNGRSGVVVQGSDNVIGGTDAAARNIISGNHDGGVLLAASSSANIIEGNFIGTAADGIGALPNSWGVVAQQGASMNVIGGTVSGAGNLVADNYSDGILVTSGTGNSTRNSILGNAIGSNGGLGINLGTDGVTPNDVGDSDVGPNNLQNFPVLTDAATSGGMTTIAGGFNSIPSATGNSYRIELFSSAACDPSGNGEGATFLAFQNAQTDPSGNASFTVSVSRALDAGSVVTATATDPTGDTSEFSGCLAVKAKPAIATTPSPGGNIGTSIHDSATVSGGASPTGTVTFNLYGPADATCTGSVVFANTQPLSAGSATSADYVTTQAGTYHWAASYSGDANNAGVTSACANEAVTVAQAAPGITTTPSPGGSVGASIHDSATVSGGASPTGTVTFNLYGPADATCAAGAVFTNTQPLSAGSATSADYVTTQAGTYHWAASYSGDANNAGVTSACANEPVTLEQITKIVFASLRDGNYEIYLMNADATDVRRLTNNPARDDQPALSRDGTRIAFYSDRAGNPDIYSMNTDGTGLKRLTSGTAWDFYPTWSPDGTKIAFASNRSGNYEIYSMNANGTGLTRLTKNPAQDYEPSWSPDGKKIAFVSYRDGNFEIYSMSSNGTGITRLTNNPAQDFDPSWSPDGKKIAFASSRNTNVEIYSMNSNGTGITRLTNNPVYAGTPSWSPDGTQIAFASGASTPAFEIYVMNADGTGAIRLTNNAAFDGAPSWSR